MSKPPSFPQPFAFSETANPTQNATGTHTQGSVYPTESHVPRDALNPMSATSTPPRYPSAHTPAYQPTHDPVHTHPTFPIPQIPTTRSGPPPPIMQRNGTMHNPNNNQPPPAYSPPLQASIMSNSQSQRGSGSGFFGAAHIAPHVQKNQDDSGDSRHEVGHWQGIPATNNGNMLLSKSPPTASVGTVPRADARGIVLRDSNIVWGVPIAGSADVQSGTTEDPLIEVRR
ncbi:hypothetical protein EDB92DRAFT_1820355 [Lactarius akahatsu]|uniref:Uncharacterized protein n=1 Tax=Lactarius akahatsu TaxID=416441 RepID=A0AAD4L5P2_9AGAM|nr:hypothetical protein EDB92DRAFT_1820355 [Lactarius akahatsu]